MSYPVPVTGLFVFKVSIISITKHIVDKDVVNDVTYMCQSSITCVVKRFL